MDVLVPITVQVLAGLAGGNVSGQLAKSLSLGPVGDSVTGVVGGVAGTFLAGLLPLLDTFLGASSGIQATDKGALAGQAGVALIAGGLFTVLVGAVKSFMAKDKSLR